MGEPPIYIGKEVEKLLEQILPLISEIGFPAIVAFYLLHRVETKLDAVIQSLQNLPKQMQNLKD